MAAQDVKFLCDVFQVDKTDTTNTAKLVAVKEVTVGEGPCVILLHAVIPQHFKSIPLRLASSPRQIKVTEDWVTGNQLQDFMAHQFSMVKETHKQYPTDKVALDKSLEITRVDLCIIERQFKKTGGLVLENGLMQRLINNARHYNVRIFLYVEDMARVPVDLKAAFDNCFSHGHDSKEYSPLVHYCVGPDATPGILRELYNVFAATAKHPTYIYSRQGSSYIV